MKSNVSPMKIGKKTLERLEEKWHFARNELECQQALYNQYFVY